MTDAQALEIVFTGPVGVGKTTANSSIRDTPTEWADVRPGPPTLADSPERSEGIA